MRMVQGNGGWVRVVDKELPPVFLRFADRGGRLVATELYWAPDELPVTGDLLRRLRLGQIEAWVNEPEVAKDLRIRMTLPGPDLATLVSYFATSFGSQALKEQQRHWVSDSFVAQLGERPNPPVKAAKEESPRGGTGKVRVPAGRGKKPDGFYRNVAAAYAALGSRSRRPAAGLAEANRVPMSTVHRWLKEARRRGFLAPGHRTKAGE